MATQIHVYPQSTSNEWWNAIRSCPFSCGSNDKQRSHQSNRDQSPEPHRDVRATEAHGEESFLWLLSLLHLFAVWAVQERDTCSDRLIYKVISNDKLFPYLQYFFLWPVDYLTSFHYSTKMPELKTILIMLQQLIFISSKVIVALVEMTIHFFDGECLYLELI